MFDIDKIRDEFPFLNLKINEGSAVYLDNAASSQKPRTVIDRLSQVYEPVSYTHLTLPTTPYV